MHYLNHHPHLLHPVHPPDDGPTSTPLNLPAKGMTCSSVTQLHSTMLALAHKYNLLPWTLTLVSVLILQKVLVKRSLSGDA